MRQVLSPSLSRVWNYIKESWELVRHSFDSLISIGESRCMWSVNERKSATKAKSHRLGFSWERTRNFILFRTNNWPGWDGKNTIYQEDQRRTSVHRVRGVDERTKHKVLRRLQQDPWKRTDEITLKRTKHKFQPAANRNLVQKAYNATPVWSVRPKNCLFYRSLLSELLAIENSSSNLTYNTGEGIWVARCKYPLLSFELVPWFKCRVGQYCSFRTQLRSR